MKSAVIKCIAIVQYYKSITCTIDIYTFAAIVFIGTL